MSWALGMGVQVGFAIEERVGVGGCGAAFQKVLEQVLAAAGRLRAGVSVVAGFE